MSTMFPEQDAAERRAERQDRSIRIGAIAAVTVLAITAVLLCPSCVAFVR